MESETICLNSHGIFIFKHFRVWVLAVTYCHSTLQQTQNLRAGFNKSLLLMDLGSALLLQRASYLGSLLADLCWESEQLGPAPLASSSSRLARECSQGEGHSKKPRGSQTVSQDLSFISCYSVGQSKVPGIEKYTSLQGENLKSRGKRSG